MLNYQCVTTTAVNEIRMYRLHRDLDELRLLLWCFLHVFIECVRTQRNVGRSLVNIGDIECEPLVRQLLRVFSD